MERTVIIIAIIIIIAMSKQLTILNLGETLAKGLGQNITLIRGVSLFLTMILAGVAVSMVGQIAFVGLMVPSHCQILSRYRLFKDITINFNRRFTYDFSDTVARILGEAPGSDYFIYRRALLILS